MVRYVIGRVLMLIPVLIGCVVIVFTINYFSPVSPAVTLVGSNATQEDIEAKERELGLDQTYLVQIGTYFGNIVTEGSLGNSYVYRTPVTELIASRLPVTLRIGFLAALLSAVIGIPLGILAAVKQNSIFDYISTLFSIVAAAMPAFWLCLLLMMLFSIRLGWTPITGIDTWRGYILPVVTTGLMPVAMTMRMTRSSMLEVIRQDYIRTARAKGLPERTVIWKHTLKNALIPIITVVGMNLGLSMTGSVIAETIYNIPGLGLLMQQSVTQRDNITTQGCVLVAALIISSMNLITDLVYALVDPRIKAQYSRRRVKAPKDSGKEAA